MTGIMVKPVRRTARLSIWPVIVEVVVLNLVLVIIMCSLPNLPTGSLAEKAASGVELTAREHALTEHVLEVVASEYVGHGFAVVASIIFGLLPAIRHQHRCHRHDQHPVRDEPQPRAARTLLPGKWATACPSYCLIGACVLPAIVVVATGNVQTLAKLYAIGVVGAIAINLGSCAFNRKLDISRFERPALWVIGAFMATIWVTIAVTNLSASLFLLVMLSGGMGLRTLTKLVPARVPTAIEAEEEAAAAATAAEALPPFDPGKGRILVATQRNMKLLSFAFDEAKRRDCNLFVLFVRGIASVLTRATNGRSRPRKTPPPAACSARRTSWRTK